MTVVVSCSSTDSADKATKSEQVEAALDGLTRGARLSQQPVDVAAGVPGPSDMLANNVVAVKLLRRLENPDCGPGGTLDVYAVTGDADALWRRMLRRSSDGELTKAQTEANGQRIRYLRQSGFDYDTEVAMSGSSRGTVLALRTCS
jgi:hypothetical protein